MDNALFAGLAIAPLLISWFNGTVGLIWMIVVAATKVQDTLATCEQLVTLVNRIIDSFGNLFRMIGVQVQLPPTERNLQDFTMAEITVVTNNFADMIAQGDSGEVYKGQLHDGRRVAVKRLKDGLLRRAEATFVRELALLRPLSHEHVIPLVGSCSEEGKRMLVYEHMDRGTLRDLLDDESYSLVAAPSWRRRVQVLLGAARGIEHLHCHNVIHGNVTSSNILLDRSFTPRLSGFGASAPPGELSLSQPVDVLQTNGYAAPEYRRTGVLQPKTDVYSLGVVMLEVLTGNKPSSKLVSWALQSIEDGKLGDVLDRRPAAEPTPRQREALQRVADTAASCLFRDGDRRLAMPQVVAALDEALKLIRAAGGREARGW